MDSTSLNHFTHANHHVHVPGLKPGDRWCLCLGRWLEALEADKAPPVVMEATHASVVEFVDLSVLRGKQWQGG